MSQPNSLVKIGVIISSVLLAGGGIAYRAGAFDWLTRRDPAPVETGNTPPVDANPTNGTTPPEPTIMPSSKYITVTQPASGNPTPAKAQPAPTILPSSKLIILAEPPTPNPPAITILPGSKSLAVPVISLPKTDKSPTPPPANPQPTPPSK